MSYYERLKRKRQFYLKPSEFLDAAALYFKWCDEYPLLEAKTFMYKGAVVKAQEPKMRAYTLTGLASFLGTTVPTIKGYAKRGEDWEEALELVNQVIYTQKFEGAAAGLLNATMITRDLGLAEKTEVGGMASAPPVAFTLMPITSGTFLDPMTSGSVETSV